MTEEYYGAELLDTVRSSYRQRIEAAVDWGLFDPGSRFHWIYRELRARMRFIGQVKELLAELPALMEAQGPKKSVGYVVRWITRLLSDTPKADGKDTVIDADNPICRDLMESIQTIGTDHGLEDRERLYEDLCECAVRAARLYLQIRETRICAIDRENFGGLMRMRPLLPVSA